MTLKNISVSQTFNTDVKSFACYAATRAIPHIIDGFKTSHRKVLWYGLKYSGTISDLGMKVNQFAAATSLLTHYHHGEDSLEGTIVGLAQDFVGTNNVNLLEPLGSFGTKLAPKAGATRYISTKLSSSFRKLFKREDDEILEFETDDGVDIEPKFLIPLLPVVLINGAEGMCPGFASKILQYSPLDLKDYIIASLKGKKTSQLIPWFKGFSGKIEKNANNQISTTGKLEIINSTTIKVTELPIKTYQKDFKNVMNHLQDIDFIKDWEDSSDSDNYEFTLTVPRTTGYLDVPTLINKLKLTSKFTENLTVWLPGGKIKTFKSPEELVNQFIVYRLEFYEKRRLKWIDLLEKDVFLLDERQRFIKYFIANAETLTKLTTVDFINTLLVAGFTRAEDHAELKLSALTQDNVIKLLAKISEMNKEINRLKNETANSLYLSDLNDLDLKKELK